MSQILLNEFSINDFNIIPGSLSFQNVIKLDIVPDPSKPTIFMINYLDSGIIPTGKNIKVYKISMQYIELPILGVPILDTTNKTLSIAIESNSGLNLGDICIVQFEVEYI